VFVGVFGRGVGGKSVLLAGLGVGLRAWVGGRSKDIVLGEVGGVEPGVVRGDSWQL